MPACIAVALLLGAVFPRWSCSRSALRLSGADRALPRAGYVGSIAHSRGWPDSSLHGGAPSNRLASSIPTTGSPPRRCRELTCGQGLVDVLGERFSRVPRRRRINRGQRRSRHRPPPRHPNQERTERGRPVFVDDDRSGHQLAIDLRRASIRPIKHSLSGSSPTARRR